MKPIKAAVRKADVLAAVEACQTGRGATWIDYERLMPMLQALQPCKVTASTPNNLTDVITTGERVLLTGEPYVKTIAELAKIFGVSRGTLGNWNTMGVIDLAKAQCKPPKRLSLQMRYAYNAVKVLQMLKRYQKANTDNA